MVELNIGDRVRVKEYKDIPEELRTKAVGRLSGEIGVIKDKLFSEAIGEWVYSVHFDSFEKASNKMWRADHLEVCIESKAEYNFTFDITDNVVIAICTEDGEEIGRGHGHIIHEGSLGIVQAASYALKKIYEKMNGGIV